MLQPVLAADLRDLAAGRRWGTVPGMPSRRRPDRRTLDFCDQISGVRLDADVLDGLAMTFGQARVLADRRDGSGRLKLRYSCHQGELACDPPYDVLSAALPAFRPLGLRATLFVAVWVPYPQLQCADGSRLADDLAAADPFAAVADRTGLPSGDVPEALRRWQTGQWDGSSLPAGTDDADAHDRLAHTYGAQHAQLCAGQRDRLADTGNARVGQVAAALLRAATEADTPPEPSLFGHGPTLVMSTSADAADGVASAARAAGPTVHVTVGPALQTERRRLQAC